MLAQQMWSKILTVINDETINPDSVSFKGNYHHLIINDRSTMIEASTTNPYDTVKNEFVPVSQTTTKEIAFVEKGVNRAGWLQQYAFYFPESKKVEVLAVLENVRDYFYENPKQTITNDSIDYKFTFKVSRPEKVMTSPPQAGELWFTYIMQFQATSLEKGSFCGEFDIEMKQTADEYQDLLWDSITIQSGIQMNPSNKVTDTNNIENAPIGRSTSGTMEIYYDGTNLLKSIYKVVSGKDPRTTTYDFQTTFDSIVQEYHVRILGGSYVLKQGAVFKLIVNWVEQ